MGRKPVTNTAEQIQAAMLRRGIAGPTSFKAWYGVALSQLTPAEVLEIVARIPLADLPTPAGINPSAWEQVTLIVDAVHERWVAASIRCGIGKATTRAARIVGCPVLPRECLWTFAVRFDTYAREQIAARASAAA